MIAWAAAIFACVLVIATYRFKMSSALSTASSSSSGVSSVAIGRVAFPVCCSSTGGVGPCPAVSWARVWIYVLGSAVI